MCLQTVSKYNQVSVVLCKIALYARSVRNLDLFRS